MIRKINKEDFKKVNEIGKSIKEDFLIKNLHDYEEIYVIDEDNRIIGFIYIENHFEITDIIDIAVDRLYWNKGYGTKLLDYIINNTDAKKIMLEVRESNIAAIRLYEKLSFNEITRRKKYYGDEDAIIMERSI